MDIIDLAGLSIIGINFIIFTPLSIIGTLRIKKNSRLPHFHKRYPSLLYKIIIFALLYITIDRTYYILLNVISFINVSEYLYINKLPFNLSILIDPILSCFTILICLLCFLLRTWMLYFDHNYHLGRADVWRRNVGSIIERKQHRNDWFDQKKATFGNYTFIRKIMIFTWIILSIIMTTSLYFIKNLVINELIFCFMIFLFVMLMIYLIHGIQSEWDFVHIRAELSWDLVFIISATISYIAITSVFTIYELNERVKYLSTSSLIIASIYGIVYMTLAYPLITWAAENKKHRSISVVMPQRNSRLLPMTSILKDAEAFELFMLHLVKEFSVENLLFVCELMQFKHHLQVGIIKPDPLPEDEETEESDCMVPAQSTLFIMELPMDIIPKSSLIKHSKSYLSAARNIYTKYVKYGCEFEINISSRTRHELYDFFHIMYPHNPEDLNHRSKKSNFNRRKSSLLHLHKGNRSIIESMTAETISLQNRNRSIMNSPSNTQLKHDLSDHIAKHILNAPNLDVILDDDRIEKSMEELAEFKLQIDDNDSDGLEIIDEDLDDMITTLNTTLNHTLTTEKETKSQVSMAFDGPSELDLFSVFDHARDEILSVLNDSYQRFACSTEYAQIEPKILKKQHKKNQQSRSFKKSMISSAKMLMKQVSADRDSSNNNKRLSVHNHMNLGIELNNSPNLSYSHVSNNSNVTRSSDQHLMNYSPTPTQSHSDKCPIERNLNINSKDLTALELST